MGVCLNVSNESHFEQYKHQGLSLSNKLLASWRRITLVACSICCSCWVLCQFGEWHIIKKRDFIKFLFDKKCRFLFSFGIK
jgi:hypothetical protein